MSQQRRALVLGASGGIGEAVCRRLAQDGWSLYLHYNSNESSVFNLQVELTRNFPKGEFECVHADFTKSGAAEILDSKIETLSCIVIANGHSLLKLLSETTEEDMETLWKVHMQLPARIISLLSFKMRAYPTSYVVFIGSIWGNTGAASEVMYSAVKGAQHSFVKAYAKEAAYSGIRVNGIAPGWIETRMNADISKEDKEMVMQEVPLMRTGHPEEVANVVSFLTSGQADYMTGEIVKLNGGWYI